METELHQTPGRAQGRPRGFDPDVALECALQVFWRQGYEGTSLSDLTQAMGINRPSLYAAFGDKATLFCKVLDRYAAGPAAYVQEALQQPTARAVVESLLRGALTLLTDPQHPSGCLLVQGALACGRTAEPIRQELASRRAETEAAICRRFEQSKQAGNLPPDVDGAALAHFITTVSAGMAVQAATGASRAELEQVVEMVLQMLP